MQQTRTSSTRNPLRILLADDHYMVRNGLVSLINRNTQMRIVAEAENGREAVAAFQQHRPDVILMDLQMPVMSGLEAIIAIRAIDPEARILLLTSFDGDELIQRGLQLGALGYCLKDSFADELFEAIRIVATGQRIPFSSPASQSVDKVAPSELTVREIEILRLIATTGSTNSQISAALGITEGTVKTHLRNILEKLDARNRTAAVITALKRRLIPFE